MRDYVAIVFFSNYTKLVDLAFLYCFVVKSKIKSAKSLPIICIEPATLGTMASLDTIMS